MGTNYHEYGWYLGPLGHNYFVELSVDNSIDTTAAYMTQTFTHPEHGPGEHQYVIFWVSARPQDMTEEQAGGVWVEVSVDGGTSDFGEAPWKGSRLGSLRATPVVPLDITFRLIQPDLRTHAQQQ